MLGIPGTEYQQASVARPARGTLRLYTYGLIEDPDRLHADTFKGLADTARSHGSVALDGLCGTLTATARPAREIALLAVRIIP